MPQEKHKVGILLHGLGANGIDTLFAKLAKYWSDNVEMYYFIAVDQESKQFWENDVKSTNVHIVKLHDLDKNRLRQWPMTLYKALKQYGPFDAIHSNMDMLNGINMVVAKLCGVKHRISHAHRGNTIKKTGVKELLSKTYRGIMRGLMRRFSTKCIGCSDVAGDYFFGKGFKYDVLFNGIQLPSKTDVIQPQYDNPNFITVGRMVDLKNPFKLIAIFDLLRKDYPDAILTWCGDGPMRGEIEDEIKRRGLEKNVDLIGLTDEVPKYLKKSDIFLLPSVYEGLSLALAEAQAFGLDCFISDTCSKLSDCGKCYYIPLEDSAEKWADKIHAYLQSDPNTKMRLDDTLMARFDIVKMARELESYYGVRYQLRDNNLQVDRT